MVSEDDGIRSAVYCNCGRGVPSVSMCAMRLMPALWLQGEEKEVVVSEDDGIRPGVTAQALSGLKPVFKKGGTTTAGNSSQVRCRPASLVASAPRWLQVIWIPAMNGAPFLESVAWKVTSAASAPRSAGPGVDLGVAAVQSSLAQHTGSSHSGALPCCWRCS